MLWCQKRICEWEELTISFSGCGVHQLVSRSSVKPSQVECVQSSMSAQTEHLEKSMRREHDEHEGQTHGEGHPTCSSGSMGYFASPSLESIKGTYASNNGPSWVKWNSIPLLRIWNVFPNLGTPATNLHIPSWFVTCYNLHRWKFKVKVQ